jgi:putative oxidoreductase
MASAYFISHNPRGFWPILNSGEASYMFCFLFLYLVTVGPGRFSLDGWIANQFGRRWWM